MKLTLVNRRPISASCTSVERPLKHETLRVA